MKKIFKELLMAIVIICYFLTLILAYNKMNLDRLSEDIKVFSGTFLILGLLAMEKAYKEDNGRKTIVAIELLVLSFHSLSIIHMTTLLKYSFQSYLLISAGVVTIYYILKMILLYTKDRKEYLRELSDISEIVKEDEPIKKEAKKRNVKEAKKSKNNENDIKDNEIKKEQTKNKKPKITSKKNTSSKSNQKSKTISNENKSLKPKSKTKKTTKTKSKTDVKNKTEKSKSVSNKKKETKSKKEVK